MSWSRPLRTLLVALALVLGISAGAPASSHPAHLRLAGIQPVRVYGSHFTRHERVRVTLITPAGRWTRHVRAGRHGRFRVTFRGAAHIGPCGGFRVRAIGRSGRRAVLRHTTLPGCMAF